MTRNILFWDVDTQSDFMQPQGRLYVPGAEQIIDKVSAVRKFAIQNGFSILADIDYHTADNDEISDSPDFKQTFPPHCMAGDPGGDRVGYLGKLPIEYVQLDPMPRSTLKRLIDKDQFHVVIRKQSIDVFDNPNTEKLIELIRPKAVAVFGVALDFCVYYALRGLAKYKDIELHLLSDVVKGLQIRPKDEILAEFKQWGVEIGDFANFKRKSQCG
jgi:nicotinamidase/pyrazinamidase